MPPEARAGRPWRLGTVRARLTLLATAVVALVLGVSAAGLVAVQQGVLTRGVDEALRQRADNIETDIERGGFGRALPVEGDPQDSFLQVLDGAGRVVAASANIGAVPPAGAALAPGAAETVGEVRDFGPRADAFRVLTRPVDKGRTLVVAKNLDDVDESVQVLTTSLVVAIPIAIALLAGLLWWLTGRVLRPVERIRAEAASIRGTELHRRLPEPATSDEIARLAHTMNAMLQRIEQATERQRQFVADASHELRSPLTRIRAELEVALAHPDSEPPDRRYRDLLADTERLQQLVDDLLFLARSESGALGAPAEPVDLDDLVLDEAKVLRERGRVRVDVGAVSAARVLGDARQLARMVRNLASNAERFARSRVVFELAERGAASELVVADDGPGIPEQHHAAVFTRFTRLDPARSPGTGGVGLGLAIVHDIVARHGGSVGIASRDGEGARFVVTLPRID